MDNLDLNELHLLRKEVTIHIKATNTYLWLMITPYITISLFILLFIPVLIPNKQIPYLSIAIEIIATIYFLSGIYKVLRIKYTFWILTNEQLKIRTGILSYNINYLELFRVKDYILSKPLILRFFGLMNLTLLSIDRNSGNERLTIYGIKDSYLPDIIRNLVQQARLNNNVYEVDNLKH